jgi:hypothetical protein
MGGVMTDEAGAITGDLEVETRVEDDAFSTRVRYAGAEEWYAVSGSPVPMSNAETDPARLHERVVQRLTTPGPIVDGNEEAVSLRELDVSQ